jgi:NAD(P)-dependent dehydrogenase (short-subunit alcohol dehydrogenase family)
MARIFITGSADGLGLMAAKLLIGQGHEVVLHARNAGRAREALSKLPAAKNILTGDLSSIEETKNLAAEANATGSFDAVIHNAGVYRESNRMIFAVNSLAPYILTSLIKKTKRLVYLSSGMHLQGDPHLEKLPGVKSCSYSDSKLHVLILSMAVGRKWPDVYSNAVDPGWVATKMGGPGAPDNLEKGAETQAWLAVSNDDKAKLTGRYFYHKNEKNYHHAANDSNLQEKFLAICEEISGVRFPGSFKAFKNLN